MTKEDKKKLAFIKANLVPIKIRHRAELLGLKPKDLSEYFDVSLTIIYNAYAGKAPFMLYKIDKLLKELEG